MVLPCCAGAQSFKGSAVIACSHRYHRVGQRIQPHRHPADVLVVRYAQANVSAHRFKLQRRFLPCFLRVAFPVRICGPQYAAVPQVQLLPGGYHLGACSAFLVPQAFFRVVYQKPSGLRAACFLVQVQVIPHVHASRHGPVHRSQPAGVQRSGYLCRQASVPCHHPVRRKIIQRLCDHAQAVRCVCRHAPAAHAAHLVIAGLCAVQFVDAVFLEE